MIMSFSRRTLVQFVPALITAVALSAALVEASGQLRFPRANADTYNNADARAVAQRLYRATLAREADSKGLDQAAAEIQKGNLQKQVEAMTTSPEFLRTTNTLQPAVILDQFYRGLFDRSPDPAGVAAFTPRVQARQYSSVLLEMLRSTEFRTKYGSAAPVTPGPAAAPSTHLDAALDCQSRVIDAVRAEAGGRVFLTFDNRLPDASPDLRTISGPAMDRFDGDRRLNYRCNGNAVSFTYDDGARARAADARLQFPSAAVRNCQAEAAGGRNLTHEGAALSKSNSSTEYVLGVARDRDNGQTVRFTCEMDVLRVVNVRMR